MRKIACALLAAALVGPVLLLTPPHSVAEDPLPKLRWIGLYDLKGRVGLRWDGSSAYNTVRIYRKAKESGEGYTLLAEAGGNQYIDNDVRSGVMYSYRIAGVAPDGREGPPSEDGELQIFFKVAKPVTAPAWEGYLVIDGGIGLKWQRRPDQEILAHNIYRKKVGDEELVLLGSTTGSSYLDKDVVEGTEYVYVITALDKSFVESLPSPELTAVMPGMAARPAKPSVEVVRWRVRKTRLALNLREGGGVPLFRPSDVAVDDRTRLVFVADSGSRSILVFDLDGRYLRTFGRETSHLWVNPLGVSVDSEGSLYVVDAGAATVTVMTAAGVVRQVISMRSLTGPGATGIIDSVPAGPGRLFIVDNFNNRTLLVDGQKELKIFGGRGFDPGSFSAPGFCAVDGDGLFYVSDTLNNRVQVFDGDGGFVRSFGAARQGPGGLGRPKGVAVGREKEVLVADSWQNVVQVFDAEGRFAAFLGDEAGELLDLGSPNGVAVDGRGRVWIAERLAGRIQVRERVEH